MNVDSTPSREIEEVAHRGGEFLKYPVGHAVVLDRTTSKGCPGAEISAIASS